MELKVNTTVKLDYSRYKILLELPFSFFFFAFDAPKISIIWVQVFYADLFHFR